MIVQKVLLTLNWDISLTTRAEGQLQLLPTSRQNTFETFDKAFSMIVRVTLYLPDSAWADENLAYFAKQQLGNVAELHYQNQPVSTFAQG